MDGGDRGLSRGSSPCRDCTPDGARIRAWRNVHEDRALDKIASVIAPFSLSGSRGSADSLARRGWVAPCRVRNRQAPPTSQPSCPAGPHGSGENDVVAAPSAHRHALFRYRAPAPALAPGTRSTFSHGRLAGALAR